MARWFIGLKGHEFDLEELSELFCTGARRVIHQVGKYYLASSELDVMNDAAGAFREGRTLLSAMNVVAQLGDSSYQPAECADVSYLDKQGSRQHIVFVSGSLRGRSRVLASLSVGGSNDLKPTDARGAVVGRPI